MKYSVINGNNIEVLKQFPDNHFDSVVTDPPYGIDFLGKEWDANVGALATYQECLRVLKPGGYLLAFSAARTYHHLAVTVEQAGFDIRDQIMWIYSSGFPKSQDIGRSIQRSIGVEQTQPHKNNAPRIGGVAQGKELKQKEQIVVTDPIARQWEGWGTQLKPAHEPIVVAQKPTRLSFAKNCQKWGVGALNIDAGRVPMKDGDKFDIRVYKENQNNEKRDTELTDIEYGEYDIRQPHEAGRFPSNVIGEIPDYQKYFYCPKVGRAERHIGCVDPGPMFKRPRDENGKPVGEGESMWMDPKVSGPKKIAEQPAGTNNHPTVKPIELMKYLIQLVTPAGGKVLDPFNGSGSTGCAAVELDYDYTGIELDPKYVEIARKRIESWYKHTHPNTFKELFE